jgi:hypothetical protein
VPDEQCHERKCFGRSVHRARLQAINGTRTKKGWPDHKVLTIHSRILSAPPVVTAESQHDHCYLASHHEQHVTRRSSQSRSAGSGELLAPVDRHRRLDVQHRRRHRLIGRPKDVLERSRRSPTTAIRTSPVGEATRACRSRSGTTRPAPPDRPPLGAEFALTSSGGRVYWQESRHVGGKAGSDTAARGRPPWSCAPSTDTCIPGPPGPAWAGSMLSRTTATGKGGSSDVEAASAVSSW